MSESEALMGQIRAAGLANRAGRVRSLEKLKESSMARLRRLVETKVRTAFIGALAAFEEEVGRELWGHGRPERACTPEQLVWREVWHSRVRPRVLNNGNGQVRALQAELSLHEVLYVGYRMAWTEGEGDEGQAEGDVQG